MKTVEWNKVKLPDLVDSQLPVDVFKTYDDALKFIADVHPQTSGCFYYIELYKEQTGIILYEVWEGFKV